MPSLKKRPGRAILMVALLLLPTMTANAFFGLRRGGCSTGCSTGSCDVNVASESSASVTKEVPRFVPAKSIAKETPPFVPAPVGVGHATQGPAGPAGPPGKDGANGKDAQVTKEQMDYIVSAVRDQLREQLLVVLKQDPAFRGKDGAPGAPGAPGASPQVDINAIVKQVVAQVPKPEALDYEKLTHEVKMRLPPIKLELLGPNGQVASTQLAHVGETLRLPPITLKARNSDGALATATKPIGEPLTVSLDVLK